MRNGLMRRVGFALLLVCIPLLALAQPERRPDEYYQPPPPPPPQPPPEPAPPARPQFLVGGGLTRAELPFAGTNLSAEGLSLDVDYKLGQRFYVQGQYTRADLASEDGATTGELERLGLAARLYLERAPSSKGWQPALWLEAGLGRQQLTLPGVEEQRDDYSLGAGLELGPARQAGKQSYALYLGVRGLLVTSSAEGDRDRERGWLATAGLRLGF